VAIFGAGVFQTQWALAMTVALVGIIGLVGYSYVVWRRTA